MVLEAGVTVIVGDVELIGDQLYVPPGNEGMAVSVEDASGHTVGLDAETTTDGIGFTVTVADV